MSKLKAPIIIANWRGNVRDLAEAKNILKDTEKEFINLLKKKAKENKKRYLKKELSFHLSVPAPFIYPMQEFLKESKNKSLKKILIGAQNFDESEKTNKNNKITLPQIKSVGAKFVILNDEYESENIRKPHREDISTKKINPLASQIKTNANSILLDRLNSVSQKVEEINDKNKNQNLSSEELESKQTLQKFYEREIQNLSERVKSSLENKMNTILVIKNSKEDINALIDIIKKIIKNIHYNFFNNLIICYETEKGMKNIDRTDIDDCQEKIIMIRRTIANMFGIDNAKKVKFIYSGMIDEINIREILENGGVDGVLINEESIYPKNFAKILAEVI